MVGLCCDWLKCITASDDHCMWSGEMLALKVEYLQNSIAIKLHFLTIYIRLHLDVVCCVIKTLLPLPCWTFSGKSYANIYVSCIFCYVYSYVKIYSCSYSNRLLYYS